MPNFKKKSFSKRFCGDLTFKKKNKIYMNFLLFLTVQNKIVQFWKVQVSNFKTTAKCCIVTKLELFAGLEGWCGRNFLVLLLMFLSWIADLFTTIMEDIFKIAFIVLLAFSGKGKVRAFEEPGKCIITIKFSCFTAILRRLGMILEMQPITKTH